MADDVKPLNIAINTTYDGGGAGKAAAELEQLTNSGKGLATAVPDLEEKTKAFVITTEAEYLAVQKAHEAVSAKIPVLAAAGKATDDFKKAQESLGAALSTERALQIAGRLEDKAWIQTVLDRVNAEEKVAAAAVKTAAANAALTESTHVSSTAMREMTVIARELSNGNFSRLPGSVSILATQFGLLEALLNPVTIGLAGIGVVTYLLYSHIEKANQEVALMSNHWRDLTDIMNGDEVIQAQNAALDEMAGKAEASSDATYDLADASKALADSTDEANTAMSAAARFSAEELKAEEALALAKVRTALALGKINEIAAAQKTRDIKGQFDANTAAAADKSEQAAIDRLKTERTGQQDIQNQAQSDKIKNAGAVDYSQTIEAEKKKLMEAAQKDVQSQTDFIAQHNRELSVDQFSIELAKQKLLVERAVQAEGAYSQAAQNAADVKQRVEQIDKESEAAQTRVTDLNKKIAELEGSHAAAHTHRERMAGIDAAREAEKETQNASTRVKQDVGVISNYNAHDTANPAKIAGAAKAIADLKAQLAQHEELANQLAGLGINQQQLAQAILKVQSEAAEARRLALRANANSDLH